MKKHEELSLEDLAIVGGGCRKQHHHGCGDSSIQGRVGGIEISIDLKGILRGGCYDTSASDLSLPDIGAVPGAPDADADTDSSTSIPGAEPSATTAPMDAELGTALPGV